MTADERRRRAKNAKAAKERRQRRKLANICINQPDRGPAHGVVYKGGRCRSCYDARNG